MCFFLVGLYAMKTFFGLFSFFKMPLQIALGLYFAFMMLVGTVAMIEHFVEDFDHCEDLEIQIRSDHQYPMLLKL